MIKSPLREHSSKIKEIVIELQNFTYFHAPSKIGNTDSRFFGRNKLIRKLRLLLTNNETKSGAYLITGFRGVGKTSFVGEVISSFNVSKQFKDLIGLYFLILFPFFFIPFFDIFDGRVNTFIFFLLPLLFFAGSLYTLIKTDLNNDTIGICKTKDATSNKNKNLLKKILIFKMERNAKYTIISGLRIYCLISFIQLGSLLTFLFFPGRNYEAKMFTYVCWYILILLPSFLVSILKSAPSYSGKYSDDESPKFKKFKKLIISLLERLYIVTNFSNRFYIPINLGFDRLREIDILKLVSRNIYTQYKEIRKPISLITFRQFTWGVLKLLVIYFAVGLLYYSHGVYQINQDFKKHSNLVQYLPTQGEFLLKDNGIKLSTYADSMDFSLESYLGFLNSNLEPDNLEYFGKGFSNTEMYIQYLDYTPKMCVFLDYFIFVCYNKVYNNLPIPLSWFKNSDIINSSLNADVIRTSGPFQIIPPSPDYLFWFYFWMIWLMLAGVSRFRVLGIVSHGYIMRRLMDLNDMIDSQITKENSKEIKGSKFGFFSKTKKEYPIADEREIEKLLLEILDDISKIPRIFLRPEFIFIFDELDKIEPHKNISLFEKEEENFSTHKGESDLKIADELLRERQQIVLTLFSNLKNFLTTAKAKFIFIAGRDMYDAALADVSDRHFFMASIFHEVINVDSFYSDASDNKKSDITSMTETYVCRQIIPEHYAKDDYTLKTFNKYLYEEYFFENKEYNFGIGSSLDKKEKKARRLKREKIIITLQNFITYLAYRSHGTPKKISQYMEKYIDQLTMEALKDEDRFLCIGKSDKSLFLKFGFYDQCIFSMVSSLFNPFVFGLSNAHKDFGDKMIVSISFLTDNLYKFHGFAFSWRTLELLPEIVDVNRTPELRSVINNILNFLTHSHINRISNGLYQFKFSQKLDYEISFLSKISEQESAAFNFTLDESLSVKRHYKRQLAELRQLYDPYLKATTTPRFIHSISFIHMILGDLHFYDKEYDDAIKEYMDANHLLHDQYTRAKEEITESISENRTRYKTTSSEKNYKFRRAEFDLNNLVLLIRNELKLGLAFEKKKTNESAFTRYSTLSTVLVEFRHFDYEELKNILSDLGIKKNKIDTKENVSIILGRIKEDDYNINIDKMYNKMALFEGIRIVYQPMIAKFCLLEKSNLGGITEIDIERLKKEFGYLNRILLLSKNEKFLIESEINQKIGDVLYYKNGLLPEKIEGFEKSEDESRIENKKKLEDENFIYCLRDDNNPLCCRNSHLKSDIIGKGYRTPCRACSYYMKSLKTLCKDFLSIKGIGDTPDDDEEKKEKKVDRSEILIKVLLKLNNKEIKHRRRNAMTGLAVIFSNCGNSFLSCTFSKENNNSELFCDQFKDWSFGDLLESDFLESLLNCIEHGFIEYGELHNYLISKEFKLNKLEEALIYYYLSSVFFQKAEKEKERAFQFTKMLYLLKDYCTLTNRTAILTKDILKKIRENIVHKTFSSIYRTYGNVHRHEIEKYKNIICVKEDEEFFINNVLLNNISLSSDFREITILYLELRLKSDDIQTTVDSSYLSPYSSVSSMYNRTFELRYKGNLNYKIFRKLGFDEIFDENLSSEKFNKVLKNSEKVIENFFGKVIEPRDVLEFLITDSIFCYNEIVKCNKIFGITFMTNHSQIAIVYKKLGDWQKYYHSYRKYSDKERKISNNTIKDGKKSIDEIFDSVVDNSDFKKISETYYYELARKEYILAIETHREGEAYKNIIDNMYYLNDDFDDTINHFMVAAERYRINSGKIYKHIDDLNTIVNKSKLYEVSAYIERTE